MDYFSKIFIANFLELFSTSQHGQAYSQDNARKHPPELRGKEIGMYYRNKRKDKMEKKDTFLLNFSPYLEQMIKSVVKDSQNYFNSFSNEQSTCEYGDKYRHIHDSQFKRKFLEIVNGDIQHNLAKAMAMESKLKRNNDMDRMLLNEYKEKQLQDDYLKMLKCRMNLPAHKKKLEILRLIEDNQVVVISGETGKLHKLCNDSYATIGYLILY